MVCILVAITEVLYKKLLYGDVTVHHDVTGFVCAAETAAAYVAKYLVTAALQ
jgi:hypothetical protein